MKRIICLNGMLHFVICVLIEFYSAKYFRVTAQEDCLNLEDRTDILFRNVGSELPIFGA